MAASEIRPAVPSKRFTCKYDGKDLIITDSSKSARALLCSACDYVRIGGEIRGPAKVRVQP